MGPCWCGDPFCPRCGNPLEAALEKAQDDALRRFSAAKLSPEEYAIAVAVGLCAVEQARLAVRMALTEESH